MVAKRACEGHLSELGTMSNNQAGAIKISDRAPPTPLGMRAQSVRFEKLTALEPRHAEFVEISDGQETINVVITVHPSAAGVVCYARCHVFGSSVVDQFP